MGIQLIVIEPQGKEKVIELCVNEKQMKAITVAQLKTTIVQELGITKDFRVIFRTEKLEESCLLFSYGIRHMSTVHTVLKMDGGV